MLGETLRQRGATVDYAETYRRVRPQPDVPALMRLWTRGDIDVFTVTSSQSLDNLWALVGARGRKWLRDMPMVVIGKRTARLAARMGFRKPALLAKEASDEAQAIQSYNTEAGKPASGTSLGDLLKEQMTSD